MRTSIISDQSSSSPQQPLFYSSGLPPLSSPNGSMDGYRSSTISLPSISRTSSLHRSADLHGQNVGLTEQRISSQSSLDPRLTNLMDSSRRSSADIRLGGLMLASANASAHASSTSLVKDLQRERGIIHPTSDPLFNQRPAVSHTSMPRTAPVIGPQTRTFFPHAHAPSPTKGLPYAFPDPDAAAPRLVDGQPEPTPTRRTSLSSMNSSMTSGTSGYLPGQLPLADDVNDVSQRRSLPLMNDASTGRDGEQQLHKATSIKDIGNLAHHHHHLHNKQLAGLIGEPGSPNGNPAYTRTPELRVSHKIAERKRRKEMKELFDELRDMLPQERGNKYSKWEILTKGVYYCLLLSGRQTLIQTFSCRLPGQNPDSSWRV